MKAKELKEIIELCRSSGVLKLKLKDVELELNPEHTGPSTNPVISPMISAGNDTEIDELSDEDLINWSSGSV